VLLATIILVRGAVSRGRLNHVEDTECRDLPARL